MTLHCVCCSEEQICARCGTPLRCPECDPPQLSELEDAKEAIRACVEAERAKWEARVERLREVAKRYDPNAGMGRAIAIMEGKE